MKHSFLLRGLALVLLASLATTAQAVTAPFITQGSNGPSGTLNSSGVINVPASCSISSYIQVTVSTSGGGGGAVVTRNGTHVLGIGTGGGSAGTYSNSGAVYNQQAGWYNYSQGFSGPPNTVTGYVETIFSWTY